MTLKTPLFLENDTTTQNADEMRLERSYLYQRRSGVLTNLSFKVSQRSAGANPSVDVAAGALVVEGTENALQGSYHLVNDAVVNLAVTAANATNPRKDLVIARVRDSAYSGSSNDAQLLVVAGTAAASPAEPNLVSLGYLNYISLAMIDVPALDTTIADAQITDRRPFIAAPGGMTVCTSATRPSSPTPGMMIFESDTNKIYVYVGAAWTRERNVGGGSLGTIDKTTTQATVTTVVDMTAVTQTLTIPVARRIKWTFDGEMTSTVSDGDIAVYITDGSNNILRRGYVSGNTTGRSIHLEFTEVTSGTITRKVRFGKTSGTGSCSVVGSATNPAQFTAEDIGYV